MLEALQRDAFEYFLRQVSPPNGLIADRTEPGAPSSIAATGLGLSAYCVAVDREWLSRASAAARVLTVLRFFDTSAQGPEPDATGYHGFYYHFLDMRTGRRAVPCELSTMDTALLMAGVLTAGSYFDGVSDEEHEIRETADRLYRRVDWAWATNGASTLGHGWTPEHGFLRSSWNEGYSEALLLYVLALGSPTFPIDPGGYREWTRTFETKVAYDLETIYAGPLFIHQFPQLWLDLRGILDDVGRERGWDYFENSRRATLVQQRYAIENPHGFTAYSANGWGFTACDGPGPATRAVKGVTREFFGYLARGAPFGPDDGTISPWAVVTSLPFAPEVVCATTRHAIERLKQRGRHGGSFDASFNPTFPEPGRGARGWVSEWKLGINEGPIVLMVENGLTGFVWETFRKSAFAAEGLRRAGFRPA